MNSIKNAPLVPITELLEDIIDNRGKSCPTQNTGFPLIATNCIKHSSIYPTFENIRYVSDDVLRTWFRAELKPKDILFVNKGTPGRVCLVPDPITFCAAQDMIGLRANPNKVYYKYLFAILRSNYIQEKIKNFHVGIAIPHFKKSDMDNLLIPVPEMSLQIKIGEIYCQISERIENNNKINLELESMAKTIYDYWFLQFEFPNVDGKPYKSSGGKMVWNKELKREIPDRWRNGTLEDLGEIIAGGTPSTNHPEYYSENGIAWITPNDLSNSNDKYITHGERDISEIGLNNSSARLMPEGTVLLTSRAPIGYLGIAANEVCTNQGFKSIVPNEKFGSEFIYHTVENMIVYLKSLGTGSTFTEISKTVVASVKIAIPEESVVGKFEEMVSGICAKHRIIERENKELISLRDFLLPLLMNGQVGFKN